MEEFTYTQNDYRFYIEYDIKNNKCKFMKKTYNI